MVSLKELIDTSMKVVTFSFLCRPKTIFDSQQSIKSERVISNRVLELADNCEVIDCFRLSTKLG